MNGLAKVLAPYGIVLPAHVPLFPNEVRSLDVKIDQIKGMESERFANKDTLAVKKRHDDCLEEIRQIVECANRRMDIKGTIESLGVDFPGGMCLSLADINELLPFIFDPDMDDDEKRVHIQWIVDNANHRDQD
jgi:hypothetical protein